MNKFSKIAIGSGIALAALAAPAVAQAQNAYTTTYVNLRAGPGFDYPIVLTVPGEVAIDSYGCLNDWSWCDVSFNGYRGWMAGDYVAYIQDNRWVPVYDYGPRYNVPIITFSFGSYWDSYYRNRPFYNQRSRWATYDRDHRDDHRPPQHREMPRTLPHAYLQNNNNNHGNNNDRGTTNNNDRNTNDRGTTNNNDRNNNNNDRNNGKGDTNHTNPPRTDTGHTGMNPNDGKGDKGVQHVTPPPKVQPSKVAPTKVEPPKTPPKTPEVHGPANKGDNKGNDGKGGKGGGKEDQQDQQDNNQKH